MGYQSTPGDREERLGVLATLDASLVLGVFDELGKLIEIDLSRILRPHDEVGLPSTWDEAFVRQRRGLDLALDLLTRIEVGFETGLLQDPEDCGFVRDRLPAAFSRLAHASEAFLRYVNAYLYFGVRILAYRLFGPSWEYPRHEETKVLPSGELNRRFFALAVPDLAVFETVGQYPDLAAAMRGLEMSDHELDSETRRALAFLDGFPSDPDSGSETPCWNFAAFSDNPEPDQFELWLRALLPELLPAIQEPSAQDESLEGSIQELSEDLQRHRKEEKQRRLERQRQRERRKVQYESFRLIREGIVKWSRNRVRFYRKLSQLSSNDANGIPLSCDELLSHPLVARFALADIYWIARILRADVSASASVAYPKPSWLHLIHFQSIYNMNSRQSLDQLKELEEMLRAVFDFVCDLVQNAVELTERRQLRKFNPELFPMPVPSNRPQPPKRCWRRVFDEELREIDCQRSSRSYSPSAFGPKVLTPPKAANCDFYWSERLITGRQPHTRIGLAFSGGGVRSATFNLGVLQALQESDLLRHVDYLSCVSGGGFIGAWLVANVQRIRQWLGRATCWDRSIAHLRSHASYLAPITGIFSADTWTLGATWLRNTFLIQVTGLAWLFVLLLAALALRMIFLAVAGSYLSIGLSHTFQWAYPSTLYLPPAGIVACVMGLVVTVTLAWNLNTKRVDTGKHVPGTTTLQWFAVLPSWIGAFLVAAVLWSMANRWMTYPPDPSHLLSHPPTRRWLNPFHDVGAALRLLSRLARTLFLADRNPGSLPHIPPNIRDYSFIFERLWHWIFVLLASCWGSLFCIGWNVFAPSKTVLLHGPVTRQRMQRSLGIATACAFVLYAALCGILYLELRWTSNPTRFGNFAFVFGPALVLVAFTLSIVFFIGLSGRHSIEAQREWWTRFGAWITIYAAAGLALTATAVFGPILTLKLLHLSGAWLSKIKYGAILGWLGTVVGGLFAGNSSKTAGDDVANKSLPLELLAKAGGLAFVVGALLGASTLLYELLSNITTDDPSGTSPWQAIQDTRLWPFVVFCIAIFACGLLFSWYFEINIFGLSQFYRNRLVCCYLGASRWTPGLRKPQPFTKFDFTDDMPLSTLKSDCGFRGPFPIFNCTLNLGGSSDLSVRTRHSASFSLTPLCCGADRLKVEYAPTGHPKPPRQNSFAGGIMLGQAVAISGAAASPNMGYNTSPLVALLLTMFNVRLGWWFANPARRYWNSRGLRFGLSYLARELFGLADENRDFLNVSDGGHFENLGVYELLRRRCKVIIAADAECDEVLQFGALGNLVRIASTDFGAQIDLDIRSIHLQKNHHSLAHCSVGRIKYSNGAIGYLIYLKASLTGDEDIGITQYRSAHPSFPHETTANQFFTEDQFEAYRRLGMHIVRNAFRGNQPGTHPLAVAVRLNDVLVSQRTSGEAFLKHTRTLDRLWEQFRCSPALHPFIDELMHITPPVAVFPPRPANPHQASEELCMALQLTQLMEDVFMDLQLEDFWDHPDNRGWAILFMRWARSSKFQAFWAQTRRTFGIRFEYFCAARLGLERDTPIVKV